MDKAEVVFEKLGFSKTIKNLSNLSKQKKYIMRTSKSKQVAQTPGQKKALKRAKKLLVNLI